MPQRPPVQIVLITDSEPLRSGVEDAAQNLECTLVQPATWPTALSGHAAVVCVDEEHPGVTPELAAGLLDGDRQLLWMTDAPGGASATAILALAGVDVLQKPLRPRETRARLRRMVETARLRAQLRAGEQRIDSATAELEACQTQLADGRQDLRDLSCEGEGRNSSLRKLSTAQQALIPLRLPGEFAGQITLALERFFPEASVLVELFVDESDVRAETDPRLQDQATAGPTSRVCVPIKTGDRTRGIVEVTAGEGTPLEPRDLELLELYTAQAGQAVHRSLLYDRLSRGKAEWERTFDGIPDPISIVDTDYVIRRANRARAASVGLTPQELVGRHCYEGLHSLSSACPDCPVARTFQSGKPARSEHERAPDGTIYDYRAYPLRDETGAVYAAVTYARDITREEQLVQSLRQSEKLVTVGQIAAGIAHEINNPLTAVSSYAQLLTMHLEDPKALESSRRIQNGIERIHRLIQNLMSFVRAADAPFYPVDLNQVVREVLTFSRYDLTRGDTVLVEELDPELPRVIGSKDQLEQVVVNLLTNASDAVAGRGRITIRTRPAGQTVVLEVVDDGVGITAPDLERIFEPFHTTKPPGKGTGLGLFVAAGIAKTHDGGLEIVSEPGQGTRARLSLPAFQP